MLPVGKVAASLGSTANHLALMFHGVMGLSITDYVAARRLQRCRKRLRNTALPVGIIADQAGFADANYFSRFFRKHEGRSPREYRRSFLSRPGTPPPPPELEKDGAAHH